MSRSPFRLRVLAVVSAIPPGRVATYADVGVAAGRPRAGRAVGNIMRECRLDAVPCHRVVRADGTLGGYGGREWHKRALLETEGVTLRRGRLDQFKARRMTPAALAREVRRPIPQSRDAPRPP